MRHSIESKWPKICCHNFASRNVRWKNLSATSRNSDIPKSPLDIPSLRQCLSAFWGIDLWWLARGLISQNRWQSLGPCRARAQARDVPVCKEPAQLCQINHPDSESAKFLPCDPTATPEKTLWWRPGELWKSQNRALNWKTFPFKVIHRYGQESGRMWIWM